MTSCTCAPMLAGRPEVTSSYAAPSEHRYAPILALPPFSCSSRVFLYEDGAIWISRFRQNAQCVHARSEPIHRDRPHTLGPSFCARVDLPAAAVVAAGPLTEAPKSSSSCFTASPTAAESSTKRTLKPARSSDDMAGGARV